MKPAEIKVGECYVFPGDYVRRVERVETGKVWWWGKAMRSSDSSWIPGAYQGMSIGEFAEAAIRPVVVPVNLPA